jgi:hypothetical protein
MGLAWLLAAGQASADPSKCRQAIGKETQKFLDLKSKNLAKCEQDKIKAKRSFATDCATAQDVADKNADAMLKMQDKIADGCEGESPVSIGFPAQCPDLEGVGCDGAVGTIANAAECLVCIDMAAADQINTLAHGALVESTEKATDKCQGTISKETQKFLKSKSKELAKCLDGRLKGTHDDPCPDPSNPDVKSPGRKAADKIAKAEQSLKDKICTTCGGPDKECGGTDGMGGSNDILPAEFGFVTGCPDVTIPGGNNCAVPINSLQSAADCLACVAEFKVDCVIAAAFPGFGSYPESCNPPPPPAGCSTVDIQISTAYTPSPDNVVGVQLFVQYPGAKLQLVPSSVTNQSGVSGTFLTSDNDTPPTDGFNDQLGVGLVTFPGPIPPGAFASATYNCRAGQPGPLLSEFGCVADVSDGQGQAVSATCNVSITANP